MDVLTIIFQLCLVASALYLAAHVAMDAIRDTAPAVGVRSSRSVKSRRWPVASDASSAEPRERRSFSHQLSR